MTQYQHTNLISINQISQNQQTYLTSMKSEDTMTASSRDIKMMATILITIAFGASTGVSKYTFSLASMIRSKLR